MSLQSRQRMTKISREIELDVARLWIAARHGAEAARSADFFDLAWAAREMSMDRVQRRRERDANRLRPIRTLRDA